MSQFLFKAFLLRANSLVCLRNPNANALRMRRLSVTSDSEDDKAHSFTVSYLINSLGLSPQNALRASKLVNLKTKEKPDQTIEFLKNFGFTETQISSLVRSFPDILLSNTEKRILPKLEFLKSKGLSDPEIVRLLSSFPTVLRTSLANQIIPSYDYFRNLFQSDEKTVAAFKRWPTILAGGLKYIVLNTDILREHGVPDSKIAHWILYQPRYMCCHPDRFRKAVEVIVEMGFNAQTTRFIIAVGASQSNKSKYQSKVDTYKKCGFSEEEVWKAFRNDPHSMLHSEDKISAVMDFFVNEMRLEPSHVATQARVLGLSLKKRIMPRWSVIKFLLSRGLVKEKVSLCRMLMSSEERFLKKYVEPYKKKGPKLLKLYKEKL